MATAEHKMSIQEDERKEKLNQAVARVSPVSNRAGRCVLLVVLVVCAGVCGGDEGCPQNNLYACISGALYRTLQEVFFYLVNPYYWQVAGLLTCCQAGDEGLCLPPTSAAASSARSPAVPPPTQGGGLDPPQDPASPAGVLH